MMNAVALLPFTFDNSYVRELKGLYEPWQAATAPTPRLLILNEELAAELGLDPGALSTTAGVDVLVGNVVPDGAQPVAMAFNLYVLATLEF